MKSYEANAEKRTVRAAEESMTVVPEGGAKFTVFSGESSQYTVNLVTDECSCPDHQRRGVICKHARRVEIETGIRDVPDLPGRTDVQMMQQARQSQPVAMADGGTDECPNGQVGCCGPDGDELPCPDCYMDQ